jgi:hypothetical protein
MRPARFFNVLFLLMPVVFLVVLVSLSPASAATITVTNTNDSGGGSLRDAITAAAPGDTIDFNLSGCPCTITLTSGPLVISNNLTITGPVGAGLTISGGGAFQVFNIIGGIVNISRLTVSNGNANGNIPNVGGGIFNGGALTLTDVTISGCSAGLGGGIFNGGIAITGVQTPVGGTGSLTLTNVTISGNSADLGGGIFNSGSSTLTNVTISGNSAVNQGGGIFNAGFAIVGKSSAVEVGLPNPGTLTLSNVTISGNSAGQGGGISNSALTPTNVTISGYQNSGTGTVWLMNTIVANSTSGGNCVGTITSLGHNLDSGTTCGFTQTDDLVNTDPMFGNIGLHNNGGPTKTIALLAGSPAIDAADPANFPPTDQRGVIRPQGAGPDIGAYEYVLSVPAPTMTGWGMIIFMLFAGLGSVYYLRRRKRAEG